MDDLILPPECDYGNVEYKLNLCGIGEDIFEKRVTQLKYRIIEGNGEAIYYIGVSDSGQIIGITNDQFQESIDLLKKLANKLDCSVLELYSKTISKNKIFGQFIIRENYNFNSYVDLKIGVVGNVDSGKSTLVGCLTNDILDDGRGKSRSLVFNYPHEVQAGRTSSIGHQIMGFDNNGNWMKQKKISNRNKWSEITKEATKIVSFYDLAGHEKYLRTTIYGLSSMCPDYCFVVIGGNSGFNHMTREHIALCISLQIPIIIIITKIDIAPANILEETLLKIKKISRNAIRKIPYEIKNYDDVVNVFHNIKSGSIIPIIKISNVTGQNIELLKKTLNLLPIRKDYSKYINDPVEMLVDCNYYITGHGTVVSGLLKSGTIKVNDTVYLGPSTQHSNNQISNYIMSKIKSIHIKHLDVKEAKAGSYICVCLKNINRKNIKKGMVIVCNRQPKLSINEFWCKINILQSHHTTIKKGYQPFLHIEHVRQCAKIIDIQDYEILRTGDSAKVKLQFLNRPEYIKPGMNLIFRDGKVKAIGKIIENID